MPVSVEQLKSQIAAYASGKIPLGKFEDWFYDQEIDDSFGEVEQIATGIDVALSAWHFEHKSQTKLRKDLQELVTAARPFVRFHFEVSTATHLVSFPSDYPQRKKAKPAADSQIQQYEIACV
jgi:hypothetical protein